MAALRPTGCAPQEAVASIEVKGAFTWDTAEVTAAGTSAGS
ncbi:hypothetical protein ACFU7X_12260 [Streptomyces chartreusis]